MSKPILQAEFTAKQCIQLDGGITIDGLMNLLVSELDEHLPCPRKNAFLDAQREDKTHDLFRRMLYKVDDIRKHGSNKKAVFELERIRGITKKSSSLAKLEGVVCQRLGNVLQILGQYSYAVDVHSCSLDIARKFKDMLGQGQALCNIGMSLYCLGYYVEALMMFEQQVKFTLTSNDVIGQMLSLGNVGQTLLCLGRYDDAIETLSTALEKCMSVQDDYGITTNQARIAQCYFMNRDFPNALRMYLNSLSGCIQYGDKRAITLAKTAIAFCLHSTGRHIEARDAFTEVISCPTVHNVDLSTMAFLLTYDARSSFFADMFDDTLMKATKAIDIFQTIRASTLAAETKTKSSTVPTTPILMSDTERKAHDLVVLALTVKGKHLEAILVVEECFQRVFCCVIGRCNALSFAGAEEENMLTIDNMKSAINDLNMPVLKFHVVPLDLESTYLVMWMVLPPSFNDNKCTRIICRRMVFRSRGIFDVRQWLSQCRRDLGLSGWTWTDDQSLPGTPIPDCKNDPYHPLLHALSPERLTRTPGTPRTSRSFGSSVQLSAPDTITQLDSSVQEDKLVLHKAVPLQWKWLLYASASVVLSPALLVLGLFAFLLSPIFILVLCCSPICRQSCEDVIVLLGGWIFCSLDRKNMEPKASCDMRCENVSVRHHQSGDHNACHTNSLNDKTINGIKNDDGANNEEEAEEDENVRKRLIESSSCLDCEILSPTPGLIPVQPRQDRRCIINNLVKKYALPPSKKVFRSNSKVRPAARELYDVLLLPFEEHLQRLPVGQELLLLCHDILRLVPFSTLMDEHDGYMLDRFKLQHVPSFFLAWALLKRARKEKEDRERSQASGAAAGPTRLWASVLIAGKSFFSSLPRLPRVDFEVERVCGLLHKCGVKYIEITRQGPTLTDVTLGLRTASVLHLATHGSKDGFLTVRGKQEGGYDIALTPMHIHDICDKLENHTLSPHIVVLSTCMAVTNSFLIDYVDGIVMALLSCGVHCVLSTICNVDDDAAEEFMVHFYGALLGASESDVSKEIAPVDSVEALQAAALRHRQTEDNINFPRRWAGYVACGLGVDRHGPIV